LKILNALQIREADAFTIQHEPIASIDLMERAAGKCTEWLTQMFQVDKPFYIFCGPGNNGGDGLAIARQLHEKGFDVFPVLLKFSEKYSTDYLVNEKRLKERGIKTIHIEDAAELSKLEINKGVIVDAIFGTGLSKAVSGGYGEVIKWMNKIASENNLQVVSIDLPSGLFDEDNTANNLDAIVKANYTLTFQVPKLSFMFSENQFFVGNWKILDINLHPDILYKLPTDYFYVEQEFIKTIYRRRSKFSHKGSFGHSLLIAGGYGKMGAAILAAKGCLRSGSGLLTVHVPSSGVQIMQISVPEAMVRADSDEKIISEGTKTKKYNAVGIGPGIGTAKDTANVLKMLIQDCAVPIVIDADGLNILSENKTWLSFIKPYTILTPHPKEFERLAGKTENSVERLKVLREFCKKYKVITVLKGAHTAIAMPSGKVYFNSTGNPGMATGGTGDVLTGIITGLIAQGYVPEEAALLGVYLHGLAGDFAASKKGEEAMIAGDLIENISDAFLYLL
jgi:ADP-dependent NAD(P)H-hydrate dehydratase / NAD(P)H-hydrate epimerase